jgi:hypothetical protein
MTATLTGPARALVPMTPQAAAWVRAVAWRDHHRRTYAECPAIYSRCACQHGACGHCAAGRHQACTHARHTPSEHTAAYLTNRRGYVVAEVWETGHRHVWTCACHLDRHGRTSEQIPLF